ncbi:MAG: type II toxin-antitoxin system HicB family antitoxin [Oscillospiraceae bacterium]|nr:type II toxin-antitoxin system HicB family antitoxin [Oscillospiraceae bacterium]
MVKNMKKRSATERYFYPAVFTYYGLGQEICVDFPDLGVATSGEDPADALLSARELLGLTILGMERDREVIPEPTPISDVPIEANETVALIDVFMPLLRIAHESKAADIPPEELKEQEAPNG